jgi:hypothetical protein
LGEQGRKAAQPEMLDGLKFENYRWFVRLPNKINTEAFFSNPIYKYNNNLYILDSLKRDLIK